MSIKDLSSQVAVSELYDKFKQAQAYAAEWAASVASLGAQIQAHPSAA